MEKGSNPDEMTGGFIIQNNGKPRVREPLPRELSPGDAEVTAHPRPWTKLPRVRRGKLQLLGLGRNIINNGDPRYKRALTLANRYRKVRTQELANMHGHVSSGASALLSSASLALAASRFLYEKFAETGDLAILSLASKLSDSARQNELSAWEMSAREGVVKRRMDASQAGVPWLTKGEDKPARGRKTNQERQAMLVEAAPLTSQREMTIDEVLSTDVGKKEKSHGMDSNRRGAVQELPGVPGDASEPDRRAGASHGAVPQDCGAEGSAGGQGRHAGASDGHSPTDQPSGGGASQGQPGPSGTEGTSGTQLG